MVIRAESWSSELTARMWSLEYIAGVACAKVVTEVGHQAVVEGGC